MIATMYVHITNFGSVEDDIFAIWKNAYGPRWEHILLVVESHPRNCLRVIVWEKCCTASWLRREYISLKNVELSYCSFGKQRITNMQNLWPQGFQIIYSIFFSVYIDVLSWKMLISLEISYGESDKPVRSCLRIWW